MRCITALHQLDEFELHENCKQLLAQVILELMQVEQDLNFFETHTIAFAKKIKNEIGVNEEEIPTSMIIGGLEIFTGALLHLVPGCGWLGKTAIADGMRRGYDGIQELDQNRKNQQNHPFQNNSFVLPKQTQQKEPFTIRL